MDDAYLNKAFEMNILNKKEDLKEKVNLLKNFKGYLFEETKE